MAYLLDSFAWLEYFAKNPAYHSVIDDVGVDAYTVSTSFTEVIRSLKRKRIESELIERLVDFMSRRSTILAVDKGHAISADYLSDKTGLHFADALIYAFADKDRPVVTGDPHFKGLEFVQFIP